MYGADVERLVSSINEVAVSARNAIFSLSGEAAYMLITKVDGEHSTHTPGAHGHGDGGHSHSAGEHYHEEREKGASHPGAGSSAFSAEVSKVRTIEGKLYTGKGQLNNSAGSPYSEIYELERRIGQCSIDQIEYLGPKHSLLARLHNVANAAVDAKHAVIQYQDGLQRGYDSCFNGGKQSVTWDDFNSGSTTGNVT